MENFHTVLLLYPYYFFCFASSVVHLILALRAKRCKKNNVPTLSLG